MTEVPLQKVKEVVEVFKAHGLESVDEIAAIDWDEDSDRYGLRYAELIAPLIKAVQELSTKVEDLESQLEKTRADLSVTQSTEASYAQTNLSR